MYKSYSMELAGRTLTVDIGRVAKQANGAALNGKKSIPSLGSLDAVAVASTVVSP